MWNVPHVTTFHTLGQTKLRTSPLASDINKRIQAESRVAVSADVIVASSKDELSLLACLSKSLAKKICIIPPGVDTKIFIPKPEDKTLPKLQISGKKLLLFVGRLDPIKGLETLIRTIAILENRGDVHLIIVGGELPDGKLGQSLLSLARDLNIDPLITILGSIDHEVLPNYYNAADILVLPSYHESFGLAALEAMSCGTPVVAARVGGLRYLVNNGQTGYLVSRHCPQSYAVYIDSMLSNDHLRRSLGSAARKRAEQFSWGSLARQLLKLYNRLTETSKNSGQEIGI
jgi:D-inositol-3-phosphate glycosyltransferase